MFCCIMTVQWRKDIISLICYRYTLLIGAGDRREDVANAARKALYAALVKAASNDSATAAGKYALAAGNAAEPLLPEFPAFLAYIMDKVATRLKSSYKLQVANVTLPFPVTTGEIFVVSIMFEHFILKHNY
jgi:hypothetical protein